MKNNIITAVLLCISIASLTGCASLPTSNTSVPENLLEEPGDVSALVVPNELWHEPLLVGRDTTNIPNEVSLILEYSTYPVGVEAINAVFKNDTNLRMYFGHAFHLEKLVGSKWEKVNFVREEVYWLSVAYGVEPHSQRDWTFNISYYFGTLEKGHYRIATGTFGYLYAEFAVV